jgi:HPt (histidine-containing phosphotransfer) domain-containing protein
VQAALARLRERFMAGLPQRWREIQTASDAPAQAAVLHQLAGVAGSFGLHALGQAAREGEHAALAGDAAALAQALERLRGCLAAEGVPLD